MSKSIHMWAQEEAFKISRNPRIFEFLTQLFEDTFISKKDLIKIAYKRATVEELNPKPSHKKSIRRVRKLKELSNGFEIKRKIKSSESCIYIKDGYERKLTSYLLDNSPHFKKYLYCINALISNDEANKPMEKPNVTSQHVHFINQDEIRSYILSDLSKKDREYISSSMTNIIYDDKIQEPKKNENNKINDIFIISNSSQ